MNSLITLCLLSITTKSVAPFQAIGVIASRDGQWVQSCLASNDGIRWASTIRGLKRFTLTTGITLDLPHHLVFLVCSDKEERSSVVTYRIDETGRLRYVAATRLSHPAQTLVLNPKGNMAALFSYTYTSLYSISPGGRLARARGSFRTHPEEEPNGTPGERVIDSTSVEVSPNDTGTRLYVAYEWAFVDTSETSIDAFDWTASNRLRRVSGFPFNSGRGFENEDQARAVVAEQGRESALLSFWRRIERVRFHGRTVTRETTPTPMDFRPCLHVASRHGTLLIGDNGSTWFLKDRAPVRTVRRVGSLGISTQSLDTIKLSPQADVAFLSVNGESQRFIVLADPLSSHPSRLYEGCSDLNWAPVATESAIAFLPRAIR